MRTKDIPFQFLAAEQLSGKSPADLVTWVEVLTTLLKPDNGIEYVASVLARTDHRPLGKLVAALAERASARIYDVRPAVYVNHGNSEGLRICIDLLVGEHRQPLLSIKTFSSSEEAWYLAQKIGIVFELVLIHGEEPAIVEAAILLGFKRSNQREAVVVSLTGDLTLEAGGGTSRKVTYPLHSNPEIREFQRVAFESDVASLVKAFQLRLIDAKPGLPAANPHAATDPEGEGDDGTENHVTEDRNPNRNGLAPAFAVATA